MIRKEMGEQTNTSSLSDHRLFAMCVLSAAIGFAVWQFFLRHLGGGVILPAAIATFTVLMFADGYRSR